MLAPAIESFNESALGKCRTCEDELSRRVPHRPRLDRGASAGMVKRAPTRRARESWRMGATGGPLATRRRRAMSCGSARLVYSRASACKQHKMNDDAHEASGRSHSALPSHHLFRDRLSNAALEQSFGRSDV